ncbi:MAG TPA: glycosyltransferase family 9 protein [candidate division Zixibacteria bacterium]|nr:glycosyltransferase family 9 protein [candidate division Zixibacteria bacterium]
MRILIGQTAFIGDCVLTTPLVKALGDLFSGEHDSISILISPRGKGIFDNNPNIEEVIVYDKRGTDKGFGAMLKMAEALRRRKFDIAVLPHQSFRTGLLFRLAGIPHRIGFSGASGAIFYTDKVHRLMDLHEAERMTRLTEPLGFTPKPIPTELFPSDEDYRMADEFIVRQGIEPSRTLIVAPGSVWGTKRYPPDGFAEVINILIGEGHVDSAVIIGGPGDAEIAVEIISKSLGKAISAIGIGDIMTSAALISRCRILIGNDSAPVHIASAMKTPVVAIFGPTVRKFGFTPYSPMSRVIETDEKLDCRPCSGHGKMTCAQHDCMKSIPPRRVADTVIELLTEKS